MKTLRSFVALAILCLTIAACGSVQKSHEMDVKEAQTDLMKYNSVAQAFNKDGQVVGQVTLVGQAKAPSQTVTTQQVPVTVTTQAAASQRPVYNRDCRAAKAVPRTPPASPPMAKTEMKTVVTTTTMLYRGPEVLATVGGGGPSTGHSVAANIPGAIGSVGSAAVGGYFFKEGMRALRPDQTNINQSGGGAYQTQGQRQCQSTNNRNTNINPNTNVNSINAVSGSSSSSSSTAGAAAASN